MRRAGWGGWLKAAAGYSRPFPDPPCPSQCSSSVRCHQHALVFGPRSPSRALTLFPCASFSPARAAEKRSAAGDPDAAHAQPHKRAAMADARVRASHLLVKHKDVRRPSSWKVREGGLGQFTPNANKSLG